MDNEVKMVVDLLRKSEDKNFRILADELTLSEKLKSTSDKITTKVSFILNEASIEFVSKIAKTEVSDDVLNAIIERLRVENYIEEEILKELSEVNSRRVREFVAEIAPCDMLNEMAKNEDDIVLKVTPADIIIKIFEIEADIDVLGTIIEGLKEQIDTESIDRILRALSKSDYYEVRKFVAETAPDDILFEMAKAEDDCDVLDIINSRLVDNYEEGNLIEDIKIAEETNDKELRVKLMRKINRVYEIKY